MLRPVWAADYDFLFTISMTPENLIWWRYRGATPSPDAFAQSLWQGVLSQFMVTTHAGDRIGLVTIYNANFRHGTGYISTINAPEYERNGWALDGMVIFLAYVFETFGLRKLYYEMLEPNYARIASGAGRHFRVEGCLLEHEYHSGRFWHWYTLAVYRHEYEPLLKTYLPQVIGTIDSV